MIELFNKDLKTQINKQVLIATQLNQTSNHETDANGGPSNHLNEKVLEQFITKQEVKLILNDKTNVKDH